ncbi:MAG: hypothetical protein ABIO44_02480, partial [Saprospiraceae bacterium]
MSRKGEFLNRVYFIMIGFLMAALALIVQAFRISQLQGEQWRSKSKELYFKPIDIEAERGKILSDDG